METNERIAHMNVHNCFHQDAYDSYYTTYPSIYTTCVEPEKGARGTAACAKVQVAKTSRNVDGSPILTAGAVEDGQIAHLVAFDDDPLSDHRGLTADHHWHLQSNEIEISPNLRCKSHYCIHVYDRIHPC